MSSQIHFEKQAEPALQAQVEEQEEVLPVLPSSQTHMEEREDHKPLMEWKLFSWVLNSKLTFEWAKTLGPKNYTTTMPIALQNQFDPKKLLGFFLHLHYQFDILKFPHFLKWGLRADAGVTRNYIVKKMLFFPLSFSVVSTVEFIDPQYIYPFIELGASSWWTWEKEDKQFSRMFLFWKAGVLLSFSIFSKSLRYSLPEDYGIRDLGIEISYKSLRYQEGVFLNTVHVGAFFKF